MTFFGQREDKESRKLREAYRRVFSSDDGREVLTYMLADLGYFQEARDERSMVLQGYARRLLEILGILHETNAKSLVSKMFELPVYDPPASVENYNKEYN